VSTSATVGMDRRGTDACYAYTGSRASLTPGVRYVTPAGSSPQTPFDAAGRHHSLPNSHGLHSAANQFHPPPSNIYNPMSCSHSVPEATPFQAIVNPLESGYAVTQNSISGSRPYNWHMSPTRGQYGGYAEGLVGAGKTPWFRRTPGARRSSPRDSVNCQSMIVPRPLFPPSSGVRTTRTTNASLPFREFLQNDPARGQQPVSTASSYSARSNTESAGRFDAGASVADGVELVISNLDYNISSNEWKKILTCELQQQVQVYLTIFSSV